MFGTALRRSLAILTTAVVLTAAFGGCDTSKTAAMQRIGEAVQYSANGDHLEAVRRLEEAIGLDPSNGQAHYFLGLIRLQHYQDPGAAVDSLERAVGLMPSDAEARYQLGVALDRLDRGDAAAATFEEVIALRPDHGGALYRLGRAAEASGEIRDAIDYFTRSIYADPYFPLSYNALGNIYVRYERPQEAIQVFQNGIDNCIEEDPDARVGNALNRADLGRVYMELDELDLAVSYLQEAATLDRRSASIPFNLGVALARRHDATGSDADREAAIESLSRASAQCNPAEEQARCNSIAAALRDLRTQADAP